jgi:hypothetical protein
MTKWFAVLLAVAMLMLVSGNAGAQTLEEQLQKFGVDYAKGYVGPFGEAFGASLNSGWYHTANVSDGLDIYIGLKVMGMPIPDDGKKFTAYSPYDGKAQEVPTAAGEDKEIPISGAIAGYEPSVYAKGYGWGWAPMLLPQLSVGNIFGTRLILRAMPSFSAPDIGTVTLFGIGVQHSISQWVPVIPLDFSANIGFQKFRMGDFIDAKGYTVGIQASKSFALFTVYGGFAWETSTFSFSYTSLYTDPANPTGPKKSLPVAFDIEGKNTVRATVGFALSLSFFKLNADYSFASQSVATVGIGFGI